MPRALALLLLVAPLVVAAPARAEPRSAERCPFPTGFSRLALECHRVSVPERPSRAGGPSVELAVVIARSGSARPGAAPLLMLAGGPGEAALSAFAPVLAGDKGVALARERDLVLVDVRGTGFSAPRLSCPDLFAPATLASAARLRATAASCTGRYRRAGVELGHYTTERTADDLEAVRRGLRLAPWHVYGVSYGTRLAQVLARRHPAGMRSLVLDSVSPAANVDLLDDVRFKSAALRGLLRARRGLAGRLRTAVAGLNRVPRRISPGVRMSGDLLLFVATNTAVLTPERRSRVLAALHEAARGEPGALAALFLEAGAPSPGVPALVDGRAENDGLGLVVSCAESGARTTPRALRRVARSSWIAASLARSTARFVAACPAVGVPARPTAFRRLRGTLPALLLAGRLDPATPPVLARQVARALPNARVVALAGRGHALLDTDPATAIADRIATFVAASEG